MDSSVLIAPVCYSYAPDAIGGPTVLVQVNSLVQSYMIWVGTTENDATGLDSSALDRIVAARGSLAKDWACAMPPVTPDAPPSGSNLFRSSSEDVSLAMAQRLARRFKKQIFLSVDAPKTFGNPGQTAQTILQMEKYVLKTLIGLERR